MRGNHDSVYCMDKRSFWILFHFLYVCVSDFHQKQAAKKALMKKALDKNPDEFYFKMIRTRMEVILSLICGSTMF